MILRMLQNASETLLNTARNKKLDLAFRSDRQFGCSITLAGYGYPYVQIRGPQLPVEVTPPFDCDVWWNEICQDAEGQLKTTGHRIADVIAFGNNLDEALELAYANVRKIRSLGSYYRPDIGKSLWPPGSD